ncbi:hypothetical protein GCM10010495_59570 [Kitasatospora herbaricolor]|nr:hypothetical protein GCM10010495_59570 [Kitasatospora herbaricolor]
MGAACALIWAERATVVAAAAVSTVTRARFGCFGRRWEVKDPLLLPADSPERVKFRKIRFGNNLVKAGTSHHSHPTLNSLPRQGIHAIHTPAPEAAALARAGIGRPARPREPARTPRPSTSRVATRAAATPWLNGRHI